MAKTILLTGGTGFLGSHLLNELVALHYKVIVIKRVTSNTTRIDKLLNSITLIDIENTSMDNIFKENRIDVIIHTACNYGRNNEPNSKLIEDNVLFPIRLLELGVKYGVKSFINTDTFFNNGTLSYSYLYGYILTKKQLLEWLKKFTTDINIINLKLHHIYGENDAESKFTTWILSQLISDITKEINLTLGEQKRDFIYVGDIVNVFLDIIQNNSETDGFLEISVGTGLKTSIKDFVILCKTVIEKEIDKPLDVVLKFGTLPYRKGEIMDIDTYTIADFPSYIKKPNTCLEKGIKKTIQNMI